MDYQYSQPRGYRENRRMEDSYRRRRTTSHDRRPSAPTTPHSGRVGALDGLRTFAILAVVLYHMGVPFLPSGHMGVVIFLVLTGFLVTSKLVREHERNEHVPVLSFLAGRVRRLWPPLAVMVLITCTLCVLFNHVALTKMRPDILPSLTFTSNIAYILRGLSYFDRIGGVSPLLHLWYLGLDMQFCIVWALLLLLVLTLGIRRDIIRYTALGLALASVVAMAIMFDPNADPSRVYYGFDTRVFAPLLGAWLGLAWPLGSHEMQVHERLSAYVTAPTRQLAGTVSLVIIILIMVLLPDTSPFFYWGGMVLVAIMSTLLIAALCDTQSVLSRVFSATPLVWFGKRSFSLYLWHYPIFTLMGVTGHTASLPLSLLALALSLLLSDVSWRFIEGGLAANLLVNAATDQTLPTAARVTPLAVPLVLFAIAGIGLAVVPDETLVPEEAITSTGAGAATAMDLSSQMPDSTSTDAAQDTPETPQQDVDNLPTGHITLLAPASETSQGKRDPVLIGDSVPGFIKDYYVEHCPNGLIDSYVGRGPDQMAAVLQGYLDQNVVGHVVVLQAFSNNVPTLEGIEAMIEALGPDRAIYLVTVSIPESEEAQINETILAAAANHDNVNIIDWHTYSQPHLNEWLYPDLTHIREQYPDVYADLITNAIAKDFVLGGGRVLSEEEAAAQKGTYQVTAIHDVEE